MGEQKKHKIFWGHLHVDSVPRTKKNGKKENGDGVVAYDEASFQGWKEESGFSWHVKAKPCLLILTFCFS